MKRSPCLLISLFLVFPNHGYADEKPQQTQEVSDSKKTSGKGLITVKEGHHDEFLLIAPVNSTSVFLIDAKGKLRHEWQSRDRTFQPAYLLENGDVLRSVGGPKSIPRPGLRLERGRLQRISATSRVEWDWSFVSASSRIHHDIEPLPNGNLLVLVRDHKTMEEAISVGRRPNLISSEGLWIDGVMEIQPVGTGDARILWKWSAWDHLIQNEDPDKPNFGKPSENPDRIDLNYVLEDDANWLHFNSIDYNEKLGQIAISARDVCEAWVIRYPQVEDSDQEMERRRRKPVLTLGQLGNSPGILYRWGNPEAWGAGTSEDRKLFQQHDVRWIPDGYPGAGNLTAFSNGSNREGEKYSEVVEWNPLGNGVNSTKGPITYRGDPLPSLFSERMSGAQKLANGNIIVCSSAQGRITELTSDSKVLWEFRHPIPDRTERGGLRRARFPSPNLPPGSSPFDGWLGAGGRIFKVSAYRKDHLGVKHVLRKQK